ncbi:hypothetical protein pb186bvf_002562 [Paramecium bursaria]
MHRIGDQSKTSKSQPSSSQEESNLEEHMQNIQSNLKMIYGEEEQIHLGCYNVNAISGFHSQYLSNNRVIEQEFDSNRQHYTSQQSQDILLEDKNRQIRQLTKELAELRSKQQMTQFEQFENYQKIIDNLKRENQQLQQKRLSNEAYSQISSARVQEQAETIKQFENQIEIQNQQMQALQIQMQDKGDQLKMLQNKHNVTKQDINNKSKQLQQTQRELEDYQSKIIKLQQENQQMKQLIEELQQDIDAKDEKQYQSVFQLLEQVLETINQFVREFDIEMEKVQFQYKVSPDLKNLMKEYQSNEQITIWGSVDRLSNLVVSVFEQLSFNIKQLEQDQKKIQIMSQQIESLEQMTVNLEQTLAQNEAVSQEQVNFIKLTEDKSKQEREELVHALLNKSQNDYQFSSLERVIKNQDEQIKYLQNEISEYKDKIQQLNDQVAQVKKQYQEENKLLKLHENKQKKARSQNLFLQELINKLSIMIGNESTSKTIDQIQELQQKVNNQQIDEIDIKIKLEAKEQELKENISENKISMNDMIEKRKEVEAMRGTLRNCQRQIEMLKEKIDILIRNLDNQIITDKQLSVSYIPRRSDSEHGGKSILMEKLQKTLRNS